MTCYRLKGWDVIMRSQLQQLCTMTGCRMQISIQLYSARKGIWLVAGHLCFKCKKLLIVPQLVVTIDWFDVRELIRCEAD